MYKVRFENLLRVAKKVTSSLNIGDILEMLRDEAKATIPHLREVCLLVIDPEAANYTRPLHCAMERERINCQLCKRGRDTVRHALTQQTKYLCFVPSDGGKFEFSQTPISGLSEVALPIYHQNKPLAVLDAIARDGYTLNEKDLILLSDLVELATNVITNARTHWQMSQEKLTLDQILGHLRPFVPQTVQKIVEKNPSAPSLEKRDAKLTVLFLDVAGYTRISESLTREQANFIIEKYFSSFLDILYGNGGDINETAGDGLMVIFQGPEKENALNAAEAALAVRRRTMEINAELDGRFQPIQVNMGINSGTASVGMVRFQGTAGTRMTYTATGPVTNLAARIASAATRGDILVGPQTAALVESHFTLYDRGPMSFKNVKEEVRIFSLIRPTQERT